MDDDEKSEGEEAFDPENLASKLAEASPRQRQPSSGDEQEEELDDEDDEDDAELTEEERKKLRFFEQKRKLHYNEFQAVKLARQLMSEDDEDYEEEVAEVSTPDPVTQANTSANAQNEVSKDTPDQDA
eukprot:GHVU01120058.1.p1 GENE.GHVU01120058.1~~GHVU01120058.1.p1  ORF type:complete len:128 (+),score=42.63 GHVU01120058.1:212-595(+)